MAMFRKPGFNSSKDGKKLQIPGGLFQKCPECKEVIHNLELVENQRVCPHCEHHFAQGARERIEQLLDPDTFQEHDAHLRAVDMLNFQGVTSYKDTLKKHHQRTGLHDPVISGLGRLDGRPIALSVFDFSFQGGSLGSVAGEKLTRNIEAATAGRLPVIIISASGGARMQESVFALMQMAKTAGALALHAQARLPYISVLTDPTYGGVVASFATLGDIIMAEPKAMIGFAGPRVIQNTTQQELPPGFQTAEFLETHGLVDMVVSRRRMRATLAMILPYLAPAAEAAA